MTLVFGEAALVGGLAGLCSAGGTLAAVNFGFGGLKFPIAFFGAFYIPADALAWGLGVGLLTAFLGSVLPAWTASRIRVSEVFAKMA
jgi:putative ABC transport system permease protein